MAEIPREERAQALRQALLRWFAGARRDLPWRETGPDGRRDAYAVWVSEVMLQQTQVDVVIPYFRRFLERFPDLKTLGSASEAEVLAHWSGLGYYRRARMLLEGARAVARDHGGRFPDSVEAARALPGVGDYTAAAVLSLAYKRPLAAIDGNVIRVLSRLFAVRTDPTRNPGKAQIRALAEALLDPREPGMWNEALMELGATVCSKKPRCLLCPWREGCAARLLGLEERLPALPERAPSLERVHSMALAEREGHILLAQRADGGRMAGLWELPGGDLEEPPGRSISEIMKSVLGVDFEAEPTPVATARHSITCHKIALRAFRGIARGAPVIGHYPASAWQPKTSLGGLALTGATQKILKKLSLG